MMAAVMPAVMPVAEMAVMAQAVMAPAESVMVPGVMPAEPVTPDRPCLARRREQDEARYRREGDRKVFHRDGSFVFTTPDLGAGGRSRSRRDPRACRDNPDSPSAAPPGGGCEGGVD